MEIHVSEHTTPIATNVLSFAICYFGYNFSSKNCIKTTDISNTHREIAKPLRNKQTRQ